MFERKIYYIIIIVACTVFITFTHIFIFQERSPFVILEELYYIPIFLGALLFGLKGALLTYLFVSMSYLPFFFGNWAATFLDLVDRLLHFLFTGLFALLAGFLIDRMKKQQKQVEKDRYLAGIGEIATTIVHDLKNPIITILGFIRRIQEGKGNSGTAIKTIEDSAQNMQRIVHDVLDFAKPIQLELKEEDIGSIIIEAYNFCKTKAEEKGVTLPIDIPAHPVKIIVDSFHIQRAMVNLINNAIEASDKGQNVTITLETKKKYLLIRIKDRGLGMDNETLENIFVPFYTRKTVGTGLGMAIAKKIIEGHKGKIHIDSKLGAGTEVMIELPYKHL